MSFDQELDLYLRARFTLIVLITPEEERVIQTIKAVCDRNDRPCLSWDAGDGFKAVSNWKGTLLSAKDPLSALEQIDKADGNTLFILKDFHDCWTNPQIKRKLRNAAQQLKFTKKSIILALHK